MKILDVFLFFLHVREKFINSTSFSICFVNYLFEFLAELLDSAVGTNENELFAAAQSGNNSWVDVAFQYVYPGTCFELNLIQH